MSPLFFRPAVSLVADTAMAGPIMPTRILTGAGAIAMPTNPVMAAAATLNFSEGNRFDSTPTESVAVITSHGVERSVFKPYNLILDEDTAPETVRCTEGAGTAGTAPTPIENISAKVELYDRLDRLTDGISRYAVGS